MLDYNLSWGRFNGILGRGAPQNPALKYKPWRPSLSQGISVGIGCLPVSLWQCLQRSLWLERSQSRAISAIAWWVGRRSPVIESFLLIVQACLGFEVNSKEEAMGRSPDLFR